jgi:F-type H+-transporting ATPase subunit b
VLTAVVTIQGGSLVDVKVVLPSAEEGEGPYKSKTCEFPETDENGNVIKDAEGKSVCLEGPSPIAPEVKELAWGAGSFVIFALLMRYFLYPRLKKGTDARYALIRGGHDDAESARSTARAEVAEYEADLAGVKAEAAARVDAARATLESERQAALAEVNARLAIKRDAAAAEAASAREAVRDQIDGAVAAVVTKAVELATGRTPAADVVRDEIAAAQSVGVRS